MKLVRYTGNPILSPHPDHPWEDLAVFNPAAWYDRNAEKFCCSIELPNRIPITGAISVWRRAATGIISSASATSRC